MVSAGEWCKSSSNHCCGATEGGEQQHNQDLKEIYKGRRILEFITFYHNALHLTRVHCATNNSNKNTEKFASFASQTQSFLSSKFSTARLEVLPNFRHAGVFQMSTMVNLGIGFQFKSVWLVQVLNLTRRSEKISTCSLTPEHGEYTNSSLLEGDVKVRKCHAMLFLRTCMSRKWMWFWPFASK